MQRRPMYDTVKRDQARALRRSFTDAEDKLWRWLRDREVVKTKFRRQHPVGSFILDFYCHEHRLAIEVDGGQHYEPDGLKRDDRRTVYVEAAGIKVMRFNNLDVLQNMDGVMSVILEALSRPHPTLSHSGEGLSSIDDGRLDMNSTADR
ncbi:MAG TPA: endonuclease domain-containing protein [Dehalococcoidia bacterium]|nr:endonuclease domain-containing protein [Dehalococcoidia bacterium]